MSKRELPLILHKDAKGKFCLFACRGAGKGCDRNKYRRALKPCDDCVGPLREDMTIAEVEKRIARGDA